MSTHHHVIDLQRRCRGDERHALVGGVEQQAPEQEDPYGEPRPSGRRAAPPCRLHVRALEALVGERRSLAAEAGAKHAGHYRSPFGWRRSSSAISWVASPAIEPAPRVITRSPGRATSATRAATSASLGTTWTGVGLALLTAAARASRSEERRVGKECRHGVQSGDE